MSDKKSTHPISRVINNATRPRIRVEEMNYRMVVIAISATSFLGGYVVLLVNAGK